MSIESPERSEIDSLVDLWEALAAGQQRHNSLIEAAPNRETIRESIAQHLISDGILIARGDDGAIVGFVMFTAQSGRYTELVKTGVIENLYVVPTARDEGIGSALLEAAHTRLHEAGVETIMLDVMASNRAAQRFYARHGYDPHRLTLAKHETDTHS
ncbi:GNAT family N-acetyltransferase [Halocatena halophila]|uniref:GNAT family N-acetyltransferase n=1 Tax=Halocatena halophila TaxID=2814576 RepID=UPI002ED558CA